VRDLGEPSHTSSGTAVLSRPLEHLHQILTPNPVAFGLAQGVHNDGTTFATRLAAAAFLLGFEVEELAGFQVTGISRFRD
jgi:hypothetical protein